MAKDFIHLHVHTQYSINNGLGSIRDYVDKAISDGMSGMAITDLGNMFGIKEFHDYVNWVNKKREKNGEEPFKPIFGCEICVEPDYHILLLAKNHQGYENLVRLVSKSYLYKDGGAPKTNRSYLKYCHEGLIVLSGGISGEVATKLLSDNISGARETIEWYRSVFGEDYYLELQRHEVKDISVFANREIYRSQVKVNDLLLGLAKEYGIKVVCTNNVHYIEQEHAEAHDIQLCIANNKELGDHERIRYSKQEWFKTSNEMSEVFDDIPESLSNTIDILNKVEIYSLDRDPKLPLYVVPRDSDEVITEEKDELIDVYELIEEYEYLKRLTYHRAHRIYGESLPSEVDERLKYELDVIKTQDCTTYILVIEDLISAIHKNFYFKMAYGRGSVEGSLVAFCLGITKIDPLKHGLLFERYINLNRKALPIINICLEEREKAFAINYLKEKNGDLCFAHIITFEKFDTKSSIKEVGRVEGVPSAITNTLCEYIPYRLPNYMRMNLPNAIKCITELQEAESSSNPDLAKTIKYAKMLEGTICGTGVSSSGIVVSPFYVDLYAPIFTTEDPDKKGQTIVCTQYDDWYIEDVGLVKLDLYGERVLTEIRETLSYYWVTHGSFYNWDTIPFDDSKTFELLQEGHVVGLFDFDSIEMAITLHQLHPTAFEDLVALNVLSLPGIERFLPSFISRKNGREEIKYDIPCMEEYLKETYGLLIYQEQLMNLSRQLAGFSREESDVLRKAFGKKKQETIDSMKPKFIDGGMRNGYDSKILEKIWSDWEDYGCFLYCKATAVSYTWQVYLTAYFKANYPAEYMSALLKCRKDDKSELRKLEKECDRMDILPL